MALRIRISCLNAEPQSAEDSFRVFQFIRELLQTQKRYHTRKQFLREDRFVQEFIRARFDAADFVFSVGQARNDDNRDEPRFRIFLELSTELVAALAGHDDVEQHEIRWIIRDQPLSLIRVVSNDDRITPYFQE